MIELIGADPALLQTVINSVPGKQEIVFPATEPFFLRSGDNFAVNNKGGG
jgi:hypothetical protein